MKKIFYATSRWLYKRVAKPLFFRQDPETVHDRITRAGYLLGRNRLGRILAATIFRYNHPALEQKLWGLDFLNPVGLSAGFDKDARLYSIMESVGFGFSEIGTVTYGAYEGNPKPRLYRLPQSEGLVVNYGLKSNGVRAVIALLKTKIRSIPQIISIGRTNSLAITSREAGIADYYHCLKELVEARIGDAYEINISCPNTFGGEPFTNTDDLTSLLQKLYSLPVAKPIFLKMPINLPWGDFRKLLDMAITFGVQAVVIGNLNKDRTDKTIKDTIPDYVKGAVSGKPTWELSNDLISRTYKYCGDKIKIIGVGGIFSAEDAYEKIKRGASLVELITGMIYEGPQLIGEINRGLTQLLVKDGYAHIQDAVGVYYR